MRTRSAYYSRNDSFSRSYNAEIAEEEGRLPRSRAAASLGLSVAAFDAGCAAVGYVATEWHHVGKYANRVDYYDCETLADDPKFWDGAASAYRSAKKHAEIIARGERAAAASKAARIAKFRERLISQRDCSRPVKMHSGSLNWYRFALAAYEAAGLAPIGSSPVKPGDFAGLKASIAAEVEKKADDEATLGCRVGVCAGETIDDESVVCDGETLGDYSTP